MAEVATSTPDDVGIFKDALPQTAAPAAPISEAYPNLGIFAPTVPDAPPPDNSDLGIFSNALTAPEGTQASQSELDGQSGPVDVGPFADALPKDSDQSQQALNETPTAAPPLFLPRSGMQTDFDEARQAAQEGAVVKIPRATITQDDSIIAKAGKAAYNSAAGFAEGTESPAGTLAILNPIIGIATVGEMIPQLVRQVIAADKTPPNSPERWQAGSDVVGFLALPAVAHAFASGEAKPPITTGEPNAIQEPSAASEVPPVSQPGENVTSDTGQVGVGDTGNGVAEAVAPEVAPEETAPTSEPAPEQVATPTPFQKAVQRAKEKPAKKAGPVVEREPTPDELHAMEMESRDEALRAYHEEQGRTSDEILELVIKHGGLPGPGHPERMARKREAKRKGATLTADELDTVHIAAKEAVKDGRMTVKEFRKLFRPGGTKPLDYLRGLAEEAGFPFELSDEMLVALRDRINSGKPLYGEMRHGISDEEDHVTRFGSMGASMPQEFDRTPLSITQAAIDARRTERGLPPVERPMKQSDPETWDKAERQLQEDPRAGADIVQDILSGDKKVTTDVERAMMFQELIRVSNERQMEAERAVDPTLATDDREVASTNFDTLESRLRRTEEAIHATASAAGSSLRAQQFLAYDDFTLAAMEARATNAERAAKGGNLTADEAAALHTKVAEQHAELERLRGEMENAQDATKQEDAAKILDRLLREHLGETKAQAKVGKSLVDILHAQRDAAKKRIIERRGRLNAGFDPTSLLDEAIIGASHIADGLKSLGDWSKQMVQDFGERIRPYLEDLFKRSRELYDAQKKAAGGKKEKQTPLERVAEKVAAGKPLTQHMVFEMAREQVRSGKTDLGEIIKAVHADLEPHYPGITEREVRDAFTNYGKRVYPSKEEDLVKLRELKRLGQLESALEDVAAGENPQKSGGVRDKPTQSIREKTRELRNAMREAGIETHSPEEQLASVNQARENALNNQIEDLEKEIRTGEKQKPSPYVPDTDAVKALKEKRDGLVKQRDEIRKGDPKFQAEQERQRLKRYKALLDAKTAELKARIATNKYEPPAKRIPIGLRLDREAAGKKIAYEDYKRKIQEELKRREALGKPFYRRAAGTVLQVPRALKVAYHGTVGMLTHSGTGIFKPLDWDVYWKNFGRQFKFVFDPKAHQIAMDNIVNDPRFELARAGGAAVDPRKTYTDYETYGNVLEKTFGLKAGRRGFDALKTYRMDLFNKIWDTVDPAIKTNHEAALDMATNIAEEVNHSSGTLHKSDRWLNAAAKAADPVSFAARLEASRWARIITDPADTADILYRKFTGQGEKVTAGESLRAKRNLRNAAQFAGGYVVTLLANQALLSLTGSDDKINFTDPSKSDWLEHKVAGHTVSVEGGLLGPVRFLAKVLFKDFVGNRKDLHGDTRTVATLKDTGRYLLGKAHPTIAFGLEAATGETPMGDLAPWNSDKETLSHPRITWAQLISENGPIPLSGLGREVLTTWQKQGMGPDMAASLMRGLIIAGAEGGVGAKVYPEFKPPTDAEKRQFKLEHPRGGKIPFGGE